HVVSRLRGKAVFASCRFLLFRVAAGVCVSGLLRGGLAGVDDVADGHGALADQQVNDAVLRLDAADMAGDGGGGGDGFPFRVQRVDLDGIGAGLRRPAVVQGAVPCDAVAADGGGGL